MSNRLANFLCRLILGITFLILAFKFGVTYGQQKCRQANYICAGSCSDGAGVWWPMRQDGACYSADRPQP